MQLFNRFLEALISKKEKFPIFGISFVNNLKVFQTLTLSKWID